MSILDDVAGALGHVAQVLEVGTRTYRVECSCGWKNAGRIRRRAATSESAKAQFEREAEKYRQTHLAQAVSRARAAGKFRVTAGGNIDVTTPSGERKLVEGVDGGRF